MKICLVVRCNSIHLHIPIDLFSLLVNQSTRINSSCVKYYAVYTLIREIQHESYNVVIKVCLHWGILKTDEQKILRSQLLTKSP